MLLYLAIIIVAAFAIAAIASWSLGVGFLSVLGYTWLAVAAVMLIDAIVASGARSLPKACADHTKKVFIVSKKEKLFYEKLKIRKWKDFVPEIGQFTGFRKNKIAEPKNPAYLERFLLEICYGEIGHLFSAILGFAILLLFGLTKYWIALALPVAIVNAFMNFPSLIILRYNSYKLKILWQNLNKHSKN